MNGLENWTVVVPELFLACAAMALLLFGVFRKDNAATTVAWLAVATLVVTAVLVIGAPQGTAMGAQFRSTDFGVFMKVLILAGSALAIIMSRSYMERENVWRFEYSVLILLATLGMMAMVSANDLIALYLGLELQSLALYVIAAFQRDTVRSTEAGLKYFVLGALSSGMLLYGASLVYGFAGTTSFPGLATVFNSGEASVGAVVGLVFVIAGLAFKVSAVPFHMWTPDVYEGAPTPVTALFSVAPKLAAIALFVSVMVGPFRDLLQQWQQVVVLVSIASMLLGAFAAIGQHNIKRLMAYSSIGHVGYILLGLAAGTEDGVRGILIYVAIYMVMNLGTFAVILSMRRHNVMVEEISDLAGLSRSQPLMALALAVFMFSMAGIPPLAGFFGKLYIFMPAIDAGLVIPAIIGVVSSVVSAYYYLRIIKIAYFDQPSENFDRPLGRDMAIVMGGSAILLSVFLVFISPVVSAAGSAASVMFR
ncbi:MAG: NADH-quinone oxidoreductase subunit NuoN [Alphaproteobacteria bacterium]|nr:NADH-quinone oxidoreductase subunit NuoN [Alphaproteobacteria bacterium]